MPPSPTMAASTIPEGRNLLLPPLSGPSSAKPRTPSDPSSSAVVYSLKLTDEMVNQLVSAGDDASIQFAQSAAILTVPGHSPFKFSTRPIGDADDSARAVCFSRRGQALRIVGPITAEMDLERDDKSVDPSSLAKMRAVEEKTNSRKREMKMADNLPGPPTKKKQRVRKATEKRPRTTTRPSRPSTGLSSSLAPKLPNARPMRIAPTSGSPFESPVVSPGRMPGSQNSTSAPRQNGSRRSTPTGAGATPNGPHPPSASRRVSPSGNSFTAGMFAKANRPESAEGLRPNLSKASLRSLTPTKPSRISPDGSRGPSPRPPSVNSPSSPKTGNLRAKSEDIEELRTNVMHILASNPRPSHEVVSRVLGSDAAHDGKEQVRSVLRDVATLKNGVLVLKGHLWPKISEDYPSYSEIERTRMKMARSEYYGASGTAEGGAVGAGSMTDTLLESEIKSFQKEHAQDKSALVGSEKDEMELRKSFQKWYPVYSEVIQRLEDMAKMFKSLDKRYRDSKSTIERENLVKRITSQYQKCKVRREELTNVLPQLHAKLGSIRDALEEWAKEAEGSVKA